MLKPKSSKSIMTLNSLGKPELLAAIDVGSNTIRLLIGYVDGNKVFRIYRSRMSTKLGKGILQNSVLNKESIDKSINYLIEVKHICDNYNVGEILAVGTSALREAKNSEGFLREIKLKTNIDIKIISGQREADLTLKGVLSNFYSKEQKASFTDNFLVADIGGGSTEWVIHNRIKSKGSLALGAIKTYDSFIKKDPPSGEEIKRLKDYIYQKITNSTLIKNFNNNLFTKRFDFIVTGGTAATIAAIDLRLEKYDGDRIHLHRILRPTLQKLLTKLIEMPLTQRLMIKGLEPDRADIIITGAMILLSIMEIFKINELIVSDFGILEGLIYEKQYAFG